MEIQVLIKPLITEKMTKQGEKLNRFGFIVNDNANKLQVKREVELHYNVSVASVNTIRYAGKLKTRFTKKGVQSGRGNKFKKAIVTLAQGDTIDFYSNI